MSLTLALALLQTAAAPAATPTSPATVPASPATVLPDGAVAAALGRADKRFAAEGCAGRLAELDPVVAGARGEARNAVQLARMTCLVDTGRFAEAKPVQHELAKALPDNPAVLLSGAIIAGGLGESAEAADALVRVAETSPRSLGFIKGRLWQALARDLTDKGESARRDRTALALAQANWQPEDWQEIRADLAVGAVQSLIAQGRAGEADPFLDQIDQPTLLFDMATERRYAPVWTGVGQRLGPQSARAVDRYAADRLAAYASTPTDPEVRLDAVRAYLLLGRYDDVLSLTRPILIENGMPEQDVTAVLHETQALAASNRRRQAIERLRALTALDPARTPQAASAMVSLAELLDESGQSAEGLAAARTGLGRAVGVLSPWGRGWLRRSEACTLAALGRAVEAKAAGDLLVKNAAENEAAAVEGLLCLKRPAEAETIAVATLGTPESASRIVDQFQPSGALYAAAPSRLRALWSGFLTRPAVKAAFDKAGRILPRDYWPDQGPRAVPRTASQGPTV